MERKDGGVGLQDAFAALDRVRSELNQMPASEGVPRAVLQVMQDVAGCDRLWALSRENGDGGYLVAQEVAAPETNLGSHLGSKIPRSPLFDWLVSQSLESEGPVVSDPSRNPFPDGHYLVNEVGVGATLIMGISSGPGDILALCAQYETGRAPITPSGMATFRQLCRRLSDELMHRATLNKLRQSEAHFRVLVEQAPEAIVLLDMDTVRFVEVNPNAESLFGVSRAELLGKGPVQFSPAFQPDGRPSDEAARQYLQAALHGAFPSFEWTHCDGRGQPVECEVRLARLPGTAWIRGSIANISARKAAQRERDDLQSQLAQSQKLEALGQLTGGVAHDFNNLLTVIMGSVELLLDAPTDAEDIQQQASQIMAAAERAQSLTHRLLAFARKQPLRPTSIDVRRLLSGMDELLRRTLGEDIEIELVLGGGLWPCEADPAQLENAILNLALNARDAMPKGGRLTVEASNARLDHDYVSRHQDVMPGQYVMLTVTDNGCGIEPHLLDKIFTPFFTTKKMGHGSGLGLAMVFGFVKQTGGHIKAYSEPGHGTSIRLYLPKAAKVPGAYEARDSAPDVPFGRGQTVLVVEDEPSVRELTAKHLLQLGYRVLEASNAADALAALERQRPVELLLTDVILAGGTNGAELAREARKRHPELCVLFMSGYTENAIIHNGRLDPGVELLEKPFGRATLARRVHAALTSKER